MTNMNYTSIEQSKKLLELGLNPKSADMCLTYVNDKWNPVYNNADEIYKIQKANYEPDFSKDEYEDLDEFEPQVVPCWSVGALLEMILTIKSSKTFHLCLEDGVYCMAYNDSSNGDYEEFVGGTILEATYNTVYWLLENSYIKKD